MASIVWSGDIFSTSCSLHRAGERKTLNLKHSSPSGRSVTHKKFVMFLQHAHDWTKLHVPAFHGMDPSNNLLENVAIITLQVCIFHPG